MSRNLETNVTTVLSAKERKDPSGRLESLQSSFTATGELESRLNVPGAASPISVEADLTRRSVTVSMVVDAPRDKKRATATVTWLLRQLSKTDDGSIMIVAKWPGRTPETCAELVKIREDADILVRDRKGQLPRSFEIRAVSDLGGKFTQRRNFVPELVSCVTRFYAIVGQHVVPWQAPPPKPKKAKPVDEEDSSKSGYIEAPELKDSGSVNESESNASESVDETGEKSSESADLLKEVRFIQDFEEIDT